jgi:hypothetical protein
MFTVEDLLDLRPKFRGGIDRLEHEVAARGLGADRGTTASRLIDALRFEAIASYIIDRKAADFRRMLGRCVQLKAGLFDAARSGDDIMSHLVRLDAYGYIYYGYAAGRDDVASRLAALLNGETEDEDVDHAAWALASLTLGRRDAATEHVQRALDATEDPVFRTYTQALTYIIEKDATRFNTALKDVVKAHEKECRARFSAIVDTEEELLSLWGIGLANLATREGLQIAPEFNSAPIPRELFI